MPDSFEELPADSFEPEGGASGGPGGNEPVKPLERQKPIDPNAEADAKAEEKRKMQMLANSMSGGQWLHDLGKRDPIAAQKFSDENTAGALGEGIAFARGAPLVGSSLDEIAAFFQTGKGSGPEYTKKRNEARGAVNEAVSRNPALPTVGSLAFAPMTPATAPARIALGTASGGMEGAGEAPEWADILPMAKKGALVGFGTSLAAEAPMAAGRYLGDKKAGVIQGATDNARKSAEKAFASARGAAGAEVAAGQRTLEVMEKAAADEALPAELRERAREFLAGPEAQALKEQVIRSNLGRGSDQLGRIQRTRDAMSEAGLGLTDDAVSAAAQKRLDDPTALNRRLRELGPKVILPAVGGAIAGPAGAGVGGLLGAVAGRSASTVRNAIADPYVSSRLLGAGEALSTGTGKLMSASTPRIAESALSRWSGLLNEKNQSKEDEGSE